MGNTLRKKKSESKKPMQASTVDLKKHTGKGGIEIINCSEEKNSIIFAVHIQCRRSVPELVLQLSDQDQHSLSNDASHLGIPNYLLRGVAQKNNFQL